jgi:hypothetical protein
MSAKPLKDPCEPRPVLPVPSAHLTTGRAGTAAFAGLAPRPLRAPSGPLDRVEGGRSKLWQLAAPLHCSVIGTCLTTGDLRALLRKFKAVATEKPDDHDLHGIAVSAAATRSPLSKQIHKLLDHRHAIVVRRFAQAASAADLERLWEEAKQSGDIPGAYWAILTHPLAPDALARRAFGDVHMLSHLVGAANRADIRRLHQLEREKTALEEKLARQEVHLRDGIVARDARIRDLGAMLAAQIERNTATPAATELSSVIATLRDLVVDLRKRCAAEAERRRRAEQRVADLDTARAVSERERHSLVRELEAVRGELDAAELALASFSGEAQEQTQAFDLGGAILLYVGGRPHLAARLKLLIDRASGQFLHHDGGIEERMDLLPGLVSRADAAFFPVDCISHDAALSLKRLCQQSSKPFVPLRSAGIAPLFEALRKLDLPRRGALYSAR